METSLHRELKHLYAGEDARTEVRCAGYRIDAMAGNELVEVQHGSLAAIRRKIARLLEEHQVRIVKPIVADKLLVKKAKRAGRVVERRRSPKRGTLLDFFQELVYFTKVFPHPRLTIELVLVDVEEHRYPGHGRRRRYRQSDFRVEDQKLVGVRGAHVLRTLADLCALLPGRPPSPFDTGDLARSLDVARGIAQRIAYCLRETGAARQVAKRGNALVYEWTSLAVSPMGGGSADPSSVSILSVDGQTNAKAPSTISLGAPPSPRGRKVRKKLAG